MNAERKRPPHESGRTKAELKDGSFEIKDRLVNVDHLRVDLVHITSDLNPGPGLRVVLLTNLKV